MRDFLRKFRLSILLCLVAIVFTYLAGFLHSKLPGEWYIDPSYGICIAALSCCLIFAFFLALHKALD